MESLSVSGRIQASEVAAKLLKQQAPNLPLTKRGKVAVKGKGNMVTYWVGSSSNTQKISSRPSTPRGTFDEKRPVVNFQENVQVLASPEPPAPVFRQPITTQHHNTRGEPEYPPGRVTMSGFTGGPTKQMREASPPSGNPEAERGRTNERPAISFQRSLSQ